VNGPLSEGLAALTMLMSFTENLLAVVDDLKCHNVSIIPCVRTDFMKMSPILRAFSIAIAFFIV